MIRSELNGQQIVIDFRYEKVMVKVKLHPTWKHPEIRTIDVPVVRTHCVILLDDGNRPLNTVLHANSVKQDTHDTFVRKHARNRALGLLVSKFAPADAARIQADYLRQTASRKPKMAVTDVKVLHTVSQVRCKLCKELCNADQAHLHQDEWIGDECCWDERLRSSE